MQLKMQKKDNLNQIVDARLWDLLASNIPENGFCCVTIVRRSMFCISFYDEILNKPKKLTILSEALVSKLSDCEMKLLALGY